MPIPLKSLFKLQKLKIEAYDTVARTKPAKATFKAQFNPESLSQQFGVKYAGKQYIGSLPSELSLTLILDGTDASDWGVSLLSGPKSVAKRVKSLLDMAYRIEEGIHQPRYLKVVWGALDFSGGLQKEKIPQAFDCRLKQANVKYTSFDRDGSPLRAEVELALVAEYKRNPKKSSPDLTHTRVVLAGDTLPGLSRAIYGSAEHYLFIARANGLDDFRRLVPGQELRFPPLDSSTAGFIPADAGETE